MKHKRGAENPLDQLQGADPGVGNYTSYWMYLLDILIN